VNQKEITAKYRWDLKSKMEKRKNACGSCLDTRPCSSEKQWCPPAGRGPGAAVCLPPQSGQSRGNFSRIFLKNCNYLESLVVLKYLKLSQPLGAGLDTAQIPNGFLQGARLLLLCTCPDRAPQVQPYGHYISISTSKSITVAIMTAIKWL